MRFPGLAQLGAYSISGLIAGSLVTRYVLPALLPPAPFAMCRRSARASPSGAGKQLGAGIRAASALALAVLALLCGIKTAVESRTVGLRAPYRLPDEAMTPSSAPIWAPPTSATW